MDESTIEFMDEQPVQDYKPRVPGVVRDVVYYGSIAAVMASIILPDLGVIDNVVQAFAFAAGALGVAYRTRG